LAQGGGETAKAEWLRGIHAAGLFQPGDKNGVKTEEYGLDDE
jgi:hypothetical protein